MSETQAALQINFFLSLGPVTTITSSTSRNTLTHHNAHNNSKHIEELYDKRSNKAESNLLVVQETLKQHITIFAPVLELCPHLDIILAHMLVLRLGWQVKEVDFTTKMTEWSEDDCRKVGRSMATFMREFQQGETAVEAWRRHYQQMNTLLNEVEGEF